MQISQLLLRVIPIVVFVWRQLKFAFFGALTSVGALFIFMEKGGHLSSYLNTENEALSYDGRAVGMCKICQKKREEKRRK